VRQEEETVTCLHAHSKCDSGVIEELQSRSVTWWSLGGGRKRRGTLLSNDLRIGLLKLAPIFYLSFCSDRVFVYFPTSYFENLFLFVNVKNKNL